MMGQMSGNRHVRSGTAQKVGGNVLTIYSASTTHGCVMGTHGVVVVSVLTGQMSGNRHVRTGNVPKAGGNVQMVCSASLTPKFVMGIMVAVMDQRT